MHHSIHRAMALLVATLAVWTNAGLAQSAADNERQRAIRAKQVAQNRLPVPD